MPKIPPLFILAAVGGAAFMLWKRSQGTAIANSPIHQPLPKPLIVQQGESVVQAMWRAGYDVPEINTGIS